MSFDHTYLNIDLDQILGNFQAVAEKVNVPVMAIVKADAYGHGAIQVAKLLQESCAFFGVSSISEALELHQAALTKPILILGNSPISAFPHAIAADIRPTISNFADALALSETAVQMGKPARFHFAVDTGMGRIGFLPTEESAELCAKIAALPNLIPEGIFSHFATADCQDLTAAQEQKEKFDTFCEMLKDRNVNIPIRHLDNSAGVMNFAEHYEMVRAGIVTYGMYPSNEVSPELLDIAPALEWVTHISHIKQLPAGCPIGYGGTFVTEKPTTVATLPVGYADGYQRSLSNRFYVLVGGRKAPILGRICMDQMMVDVTDIPGLSVGTPVTLIGKNGDFTISVEEISAVADSFNYEFVCGISRRVPRLYYQNGQQVAQVHYLLDK